MTLHPLDFTQEELESKLKDKKEHVEDLLVRYKTSRDAETKDKIEEILFPAFDEIVKERMNYFFENLVSIDDID